MRIWPGVLLLIALTGSAQAKPWWLRGTEGNQTDFLPPDVAFRVGSSVDGTLIHVRWAIADGYYLYRSRIEIKAESPDLSLGGLVLPQGTLKTDPYLGRQEIYERQLDATVPYSRIDAGAHPIQIKVTYQGCAEAGLCYPPITKVLFPAAPSATESRPSAVDARVAPGGWERGAILGGAFAFLVAGILLRRGRTLETPPA
ncbi:MAG TPA: protein-disulfide reductase DsbD domain-containing protein [Steroidobacteraceae bacterium]|jgi:thiol:disulfide interchange protein DsbD|nr:protein-disulfide reductase DsbD domain-containing protein [Steroidobacteraceae bacterium]